MHPLKLTVAYDGTEFCGWQVQTNGRSVQGSLEAAIAAVTGRRQRVIASGRTDAGVHALGQVVGMTTESDLSLDTLRNALNAHLPVDLRVREIERVPAEFHAIRDAQSKRYRYVIQNGGVSDPIQRRFCWHVPRELNVDAMQDAVRMFIGRHDFASFQAAGSPRKTTRRTVHDLTLESRRGDTESLVTMEIEADGFLYNMVRNIVGSLVEVGKARRDAEWLQAVIRARDRRVAGPTAPPQGLFLVSVRY